MRITQVLFKRNTHAYYKTLWENRRSVKKVHDMGIPPLLMEKGIPVYDALTFANERPRVDLSKYFPPVPTRTQPDWAYMIGHKCRLLEGPLQAQILTNCLGNTRLPQAYAERFHQTSITDEEIGWLSDRLQTLSYDAKQFKLPLRVDPERTWYRYPREYGPGIGRQTLELSAALNDFVRLHSSSGSGALKPLVHELSCQYVRPPRRDVDDETKKIHAYVFQGFASSVTTASRPLPTMTSTTGLDAPTGPLPSMYPAQPEMDLTKRFDYDPTTVPSLLSASGEADQSAHLHTLFITHPWMNDDWKLPEKLGRAMLQSYTFAAAQAQARRGSAEATSAGDGVLPSDQRICVQTVYHDLDTIGFLVFQLNTLAPGRGGEPEGSVRNEMWHEAGPLREGDGLNQNVLKWLKVFYET